MASRTLPPPLVLDNTNDALPPYTDTTPPPPYDEADELQQFSLPLNHNHNHNQHQQLRVPLKLVAYFLISMIGMIIFIISLSIYFHKN